MPWALPWDYGFSIVFNPMLSLARVLIWLLSLLPLWLLHALAVPLAGVLSFRDRRKARVVATNLKIAFPELNKQDRQALVRSNRIEMVRLVLETGAVWYWPEKRLKKHVRSVQGLDVLHQAVAEGNGVLLVGAHLGNWEILTLSASLEVPLVALYRAPEHPGWQQAITDSRQRFGGELVASGGPAMRKLLRQLRDGKTAGILVDQQPKQGDGEFAPFFGRPALTMTLPYRLVQKTGCRLVFIDCIRLDNGKGWTMHYRAAPDAVYDDNQAVALSAMNQSLTKSIRQHPSQYLWRYKRFARQPDGVASPYERKPV